MIHGSRSTYNYHKCRCDPCREAAVAYAAEYRERLRAKPLSANDPRHGKATTYVNYGCRCERCTKAWAVYFYPYSRAWKAKQKATS